MKRVFVCCPGNSVTGGPELLHQFVHELRRNGVDAKILYTPLDKTFYTPNAYKNYDVEVGTMDIVDENDVIVMPEVATGLARRFKRNPVYIWWLSVDNYYQFKGGNKLKEYLSHFRQIVKRKRLSLVEMKLRNYTHLVQSEYARLFLEKNGIPSLMLTDYLNEEHLEQRYIIKNKEKKIAYNPKKGFSYTKELIDTYPDLDFVPIENMTAVEVRTLLQSSMVYIDFGRHPGKDRFPREAAMAGCCIITGKYGSAGNDIDVCIPTEFKLDTNAKDFRRNFNKIITETFSSFDIQYQKFENYRNMIVNEKTTFQQQVKGFLSSLL